MDEPIPSFGARLKWARERARLPDGATVSQKRLAKIAHLAPAHVGLLENESVKRPDMNTASSLAAALGTSMDWLWTGVGDAPTEAESNAALASAISALDPNDIADVARAEVSP